MGRWITGLLTNSFGGSSVSPGVSSVGPSRIQLSNRQSSLRSVCDFWESKNRVAFQGERGAFSEEAAVKLLGEEIHLVPRQTFATLFASLDEGVADHILAPIENSIAGPVQAAVDLLRTSDLEIVGEITIPVAQQLIACPGVSFNRDRRSAISSDGPCAM